MKVTITGLSDDLVEVEGDLKEEFCADDVLLIFGDGTEIRAKYADDGLWHIARTKVGTGTYTHVSKATDPDGVYTDKVTLEGDLKSVEKYMTRQQLVDALEEYVSWYDYDESTLRAVWALIHK